MNAWSLPPLSLGDFAPPFALPARTISSFNLTAVPGRYLLICFMPSDPAARAAALAAFEPYRARFDDQDRAAFFIVGEADGPAVPPDRVPGQRWFFDAGREVARLYRALDADGTERPFWLVLDPMLRVLDKAPLSEGPALLARMDALPVTADHAGAPLVAPAAIVPRVFSLDLCRRLIAYYDADGGKPSGVMRDIGGKTVGVLDAMKSRRDAVVVDPALKQEIILRLRSVLVPEIRKVFQFEATRLERYLVACYDAAEGGYFRPHRDNESRGTAHRRFAVSINLNAEEFQGGDLRFPEFGPRTYRPPTGGAVVFCCNLQHEATPVTSGRRYAFLPFLYDEEGQRIRDQNQAFLDQGPALVLDNR